MSHESILGPAALPLALIRHKNSMNTGDSIQQLAVLHLIHQFAPTRMIEYYIDRDTMELYSIDGHRAEPKTPVTCIISGWWDGNYSHVFPPPENKVRDPLIISFHVNETKKDSTYDWLDKEGYSTGKSRSLINSESIAMLAGRPVGCRDPHTTRKFHDAGYSQAYLSRCLTMTLGWNTQPVPWEQRTLMLAVDIDLKSDTAMNHIPESIREQLVSISHVWTGDLDDCSGKMREADKLLSLYRKAKLVVTSRLHCALPCLSFRTPVVFDYYNMEDVRFQGLLTTVSVLGKDEIYWDDLEKHVERPRDWDLKVQAMVTTVKAWIAKQV